jgi:type 1 glutamine amidotransferase
MRHLAFVVGDPEYESHTSMAAVAKKLSKDYGYGVTQCVTSVIPDAPDFPLSEFSNLEALADADLMVIFTRFRVLPDRQMEMIEAYLESGRPVVGLRTASHSFHFPPESRWHSWNDGFGRDVLGTPWISHHGAESSTDVSIIESEWGHPILQGVEERFHVRSWLYDVLPLPDTCSQLLWGVPINPNPERQSKEYPVAWTKTHKGARVFFTTLGHPQDFDVSSFRDLLVNGIRWATGDL